jgi:NAD+ synthase (glutamine-hydrolysing)
MRIAILQINPTPGDLNGNSALIVEGVKKAKEHNVSLVFTPELALMGYLPRDLLMSHGFIRRGGQKLREMAAQLADAPPVLVGVATANPSDTGRSLFNSAVLINGGGIGPEFHKSLLPTYDVFDEDRYFEPGCGPQILELNGVRLGISICEDLWNDRDFWQRRRYHVDPVESLVRSGAQAIVNLSASPFTAGKQELREKMLGHTAAKHHLPLLYANQVGGNDDLIFDGRSCAFDLQGRMIARSRGFAEDLTIVDLDSGERSIAPDDFQPESEIWRALVLGVRDYARKTGFSKALLGLSGGIDSALTAAIAAEALGASNVLGVMMPSPYSSPGSIDDSLKLAGTLGIRTVTLAIRDIMSAYEGTLNPVFTGMAADVTEENVQSRIRGNLLMALSNKYGSLLLTTGNKSELAVGYCTLYGDMNGGLAVIADLPKTMVYRVSRWRNQISPEIPENILTKAPSAELKPDQKDQDTLPPYDELDAILELHLEQCLPGDEIIARGHDPVTVQRVLRMFRNSEFKRRQAAPGLKVTSRAFGIGWRMPIARKD